MDLKIKIGFLSCVELGMGLYIGKKLGEVVIEKGIPVLRKLLAKEI